MYVHHGTKCRRAQSPGLPRTDILGNPPNDDSYTRIPIRYRGVGRRACSASFLEEFFSETSFMASVLLGGLVHQVAPPLPHPLKALLLRPLPEARGRLLLCFFFEAAKLRAKLLRVLAKRQPCFF